MNKSIIEKYYDTRSTCQVLGILMKDPKKVKSKEYTLEQEDFVGGFFQVIFTCIYNLARQGVEEIKLNEIETYLNTTDPIGYKKVFEKHNGAESILKMVGDANEANFEHHYNVVRKMALLRSYLQQGVDVREILDMTEIDPKVIRLQRESFNNKSIDDIIKDLDKKNLEAKKRFTINSNTSRRKAGDGSFELRELMKQSPSYGFNLESGYLNNVTRGCLNGKFWLETRDTGMGKSRISLKRLLQVTAPYLWDYKTQQFIENPNGKNNSGLYIGTEMDTYAELEPIMWAIVSGIEEDKIKDNDLTEEEEKRIQKAIEILQNTKLYLEDNPNFDTSYLWSVIEEYKIKHDICVVAIDYIELNTALIAEFAQASRNMGIREDQVLLELSANIKNIAEKLDVFVMTFTQTTDEARKDGARDQRAVKGARSLPNKADVGIVTFEPTKKELEKVQPILDNINIGLVEHKHPNVCYSFYKNRSGKIKDVKVWGYQNLGNMEYVDMFCTNENYERINIDPVHIQVVDDKIITS